MMEMKGIGPLSICLWSEGKQKIMAEFVQCDGQVNYRRSLELCFMLIHCNPKVHDSFFTKIELN